MATKTFVVTVQWETSSTTSRQMTYAQSAESAAEISQAMSDGIASGGLVQPIGPDGATAFLADRFIDMDIREQGATP